MFKKKKDKRRTQKVCAVREDFSSFNDTMALCSEHKHLLFQGDEVFVARVLPGEPQRQVVGFRPESTKGAKVTISYSVTTKHTNMQR